jgi:hypothetical protein
MEVTKIRELSFRPSFQTVEVGTKEIEPLFWTGFQDFT